MLLLAIAATLWRSLLAHVESQTAQLLDPRLRLRRFISRSSVPSLLRLLLCATVTVGRHFTRLLSLSSLTRCERLQILAIGVLLVLGRILSPALSEICVVFIADLGVAVGDFVRHCCLLAHLEQVLPMRLNVAEHLIAVGGHWTLASLGTAAPNRITAWLRRLEGRSSPERVQVFVLDQVGSDQVLAELAAGVIRHLFLDDSLLLGLPFVLEE